VTDDAPLHHRRTIRLSGWDYSADGAYFVTVCTSDRSHLFGEIADGHMRVNALGAVVADSWRWLASQYTHVTLDDWCLMPNHLHGLLILTGRGGSRTALTDTSTPGGDAVMTPRKPVGRLIGAFKTVSTKHINRLRNTPAEVVWQRNFWEHIVRDDGEMDLVRAYIRDNPTNWSSDALNDGMY
jgi:REP-associated tyrosine transposase